MQPYLCLVQTFSSLQKEDSSLLGSQPHFPSPAPGNDTPFCLYGFADSGHFTSRESYNTLRLVSGFFHSARCFGGSSTLWGVSELHSFILRLNKNIPLRGQTILVYASVLSIHAALGLVSVPKRLSLGALLMQVPECFGARHSFSQLQRIPWV